jgi:hypothetical protein
MGKSRREVEIDIGEFLAIGEGMRKAAWRPLNSAHLFYTQTNFGVE